MTKIQIEDSETFTNI